MTSTFHRLFAGIASAIVLIALVWGFILVGSPGTGRSQRFDEKRLEDLRMIQTEVLNIVYEGQPWNGDKPPEKKHPIPANLDDLVSGAVYTRPSITDPETGAPYAYDVLDSNTFKMCATFAYERDLSYDIGWNHTPGEQCYLFDVTESQTSPNPYNQKVKPVAAPAPAPATAPVK